VREPVTPAGSDSISLSRSASRQVPSRLQGDRSKGPFQQVVKRVEQLAAGVPADDFEKALREFLFVSKVDGERALRIQGRPAPPCIDPRMSNRGS